MSVCSTKRSQAVSAFGGKADIASKLLTRDGARRIAVNIAGTDADLAKRKAAELAALKLVRNE